MKKPAKPNLWGLKVGRMVMMDLKEKVWAWVNYEVPLLHLWLPCSPPNNSNMSLVMNYDMIQETSSDESGENNKCCTDCKTTKTPLWRGGPAGPKVNLMPTTKIHWFYSFIFHFTLCYISCGLVLLAYSTTAYSLTGFISCHEVNSPLPFSLGFYSGWFHKGSILGWWWCIIIY